jgi:hypothetical protein
MVTLLFLGSLCIIFATPEEYCISTCSPTLAFIAAALPVLLLLLLALLAMLLLLLLLLPRGLNKRPTTISVANIPAEARMKIMC